MNQTGGHSEIAVVEGGGGAAVGVLPYAQTHHAHRAERTRRLKLSILSSLLVRPLSLIVPLVTVPLFLRYLGSEGYGLFESIGAIAAWIGLSNLGASMGLVNKLTDCHVSGDRLLARRYVSSLFMGVLAMAGIAAVVVLLATLLVPWGRVFPTTDGRFAAQLPWAVGIAGVAALLGLLVDLPPTAYTAFQELHRNNAWDAVVRLMSLAAVIMVVHTHWGLIGVVLAGAAVPPLVRLGNLIWLITYEKPWLRPSFALFERRLLQAIISQSVFLFLLQMGLFALYQADKLIISTVLEPSLVTGYAVLGRLFLIAYGGYMLVLAPMWPAHGEALRRNDIAWIRRALSISIALGCSLMAVCGVVMYFYGNQLIRLWTHGAPVHVSKSLILAMSAMFVVRAWVDCRAVILNAVPVLIPQVIFFCGHAALNLAVGIWAAKHFGVEGVAWSTPVTALVTSAWGYPWMTRRLLARGMPAVVAAPLAPVVGGDA